MAERDRGTAQAQAGEGEGCVIMIESICSFAGLLVSIFGVVIGDWGTCAAGWAMAAYFKSQQAKDIE